MERNQLLTHTLFKEVELIQSNFQKTNANLPEIYQAAEFINSVFDRLITQSLVPEEGSRWQRCAFFMVFGSYQSWINSYIMTATGFNDIGLMSLRRAIEVVCYLAKIYNDDERAALWIEKGKDISKRKQFSNIFSVPQKYFSDKYKHLHHLLVLHDYASDYGSHGNFEVLIDKYKGSKDSGNVIVSLQSLREDISPTLGMIVLAAYKILQSITIVLKEKILDSEKFEQNFEALKYQIKLLRKTSAEKYFKGNIPHEIAISIQEDSNVAYDEYFRKLVESLTHKE